MNPFAVIQTGGKQYRVEPNQLIEVERVTVDKKKKDFIFDQVLFLRDKDSVKVGTPYVKGASVVCEYLGEIKGPKKVIFRMKRRKNYRRKKGHRQIIAQLKIKEIQSQS